MQVRWPFGWTATTEQAYVRDLWHGSLLESKRDGSGLLFRRHRYVDPASGRFTQEDPIGLAGGLNLYGFAAGDPVNYSDPFGLQACDPPDDPKCTRIPTSLPLGRVPPGTRVSIGGIDITVREPGFQVALSDGPEGSVLIAGRGIARANVPNFFDADIIAFSFNTQSGGWAAEGVLRVPPGPQIVLGGNTTAGSAMVQLRFLAFP